MLVPFVMHTDALPEVTALGPVVISIRGLPALALLLATAKGVAIREPL
jgi:hypothetical protein